MQSYVLVFLAVIATIQSARAAVLPAPVIKELVDASFKEVDQNADGKIALAEDVQYFKSKLPELPESEIKADFVKGDLNGDGVVDKAEATAAVEKMTAEELAEQVVAGLLVGMAVEFKSADSNGDGKISKEEANAYIAKQKQ